MLEKILQGKSELFLIDLSWMLHRYYATLKWMKVENKGQFKPGECIFDTETGKTVRPTGHIYGVLDALVGIKETYPNSVIIVTQDGKPVDRIKAVEGLVDSTHAGYKEGRAELEFNFYKDITIIKAACFLMENVFWSFNEDKECDDQMYCLSRIAERIEGFKGQIYIYSGDNDLLQAISDRTVVTRQKASKDGYFIKIDRYSVMNDEVFTKKFKGVDPEHLTYFRCIVGDSSDKLKGVERFPRDLAKRIAMGCESLEDIFNFMPLTNKEAEWCQKLKDKEELVRVNYSVMKLRDDYEPNLERKDINRDLVLNILRRLMLNKYVKAVGGD